MKNYYAKFSKKGENETRVDTRIYFGEDKPDLNNGDCLGIVILKNPGSAKAIVRNKLAKLDPDNDKALPWIENMYRTVMNELNYDIKDNEYIRVCNLIPLCEPNISEAIKSLETEKYSIEEINYKEIPFVLYAWGWETELNCYRESYLKILAQYNTTAFFVRYDFNGKNRYKIIIKPCICIKI